MYKRVLFLTYITLLLVIAITSYPSPSYAHPGRTASDGCHYCRTNCDYWHVPWNVRHCDGGSMSSYQAPSEVVNNPIPKCPANSVRAEGSDTCTCVKGYCPFIFGNQCNKLPSYAHCITSKTDSWECDDGYEEVNEKCVPITVNPSPSVVVQDSFPPTNPAVRNENQIQDEYQKDLNEIANDTKTEAETERDKNSSLPAMGVLSVILVGSGLAYMFKKK